MKVSEGTLRALTTVITGNPNGFGEKVSFYRTGKEISDFSLNLDCTPILDIQEQITRWSV